MSARPSRRCKQSTTNENQKKLLTSTENVKSTNADAAKPKNKPVIKYRKTESKNIKALASKTATLYDDDDTKDVPCATKILKFTGVVPVDEECHECSKNCHVYRSGETVYNAMLNQTNVGQNNNKYYFLQLLKHNSRQDYFVWFRWGRVGKIAGTKLENLPLDEAIQSFEKKFKEKTKNVWEERHCFEKYPQKYDLLQMDYGKSDSENKQSTTLSKKTVASKLHRKVQAMMSLLFNVHEFEESVKEMQYDIKKAPLGKLTDQQIKAGYSSLKKIEACLKIANFGPAVTEACSEFYTRIPHDFGMKRPPLIRSRQEIKDKLQLLEALGDIKVAIAIMNASEKGDAFENPHDVHYKSLNCDIVPLAKSHKEFKIIQLYVKNTHASTHNNYELYVEDVFQLSKDDCNKKFMKSLGNRMLLWHGSRLTNWCGILQQGLKIAPTEAPVTGYMFGKGVYFASMVSKSANYCFATQRQPSGFLLLCEVALGCINEKYAADYDANELPAGKHSTKGMGKTAPDPSQAITMEDGTLVPLGRPMSTAEHSVLLYDEYVVYNTSQVRPRYLVKVKFSFNQKW